MESEPEPAPRRQREARETKPKRAPHEPHEHLDVRKMKEESQAKVMKIAWIATAIMVLIAGSVALYANSKQNSIKAALAEVIKERQDFKARVLAVNMNDEAALKAMRKEINEDKYRVWKGKDIENDITAHLLKINGAIALIEKTKTLTDQLKGIETQLAANPPAEQLAKLFVQVRDTELASQANDAGGSYKTQYDADVKAVTNKYVEALRAKATAAQTQTTVEGLAPFGQLEDTLHIILGKAMEANDVDAQNQYKPAWSECVKQINEIAERVFDDAFIEKVPTKDLLADKSAWMVLSTATFVPVLGSPMNLGNAEGGQSGGVLYTPGGQWRDYVLEMEVNLKKGTLTVFTRVGDENKLDTKVVPGFTFGTKNVKVNAEYGRTTNLVVKVIGKKINVFVDGSPLWNDDSLNPLTISRRGKPCIGVMGGTEATITKMKVRLLR